ncbi:MAG: paraquat-inducible protein B [Flavobacteriales bacterium]|jgi:paraquat-inducible protein B
MVNEPIIKEINIIKKIKTLSPVWIVPFVAVVIAIWLAVEARMEKGAEITISFANASDIVPGKTQVRLKDVKVGVVTKVNLSQDLKAVVVKVEIDRAISSHLSENSRFWVVTPRISAAGVSNLGTLINGVYIVMDPGDPGASEKNFRGLDEPPSFHSDEPGSQFRLQSETLASLDIGSPVYYRQIRVGEVTGYNLSEDQKNVDVNIFIRSPHDKLVQSRSRFWNVSGFGVSINADGMKAKMASLTSLISGGIEFDNTASFTEEKPAEAGHTFYLYPDRESVLEGRFNIKYHYLLKFSGSVRGLTVGAPVEFRGIKVGEVVDVVLDNADNADKSLFVYIAMEPQRFDPNDSPTRAEVDERMRTMVQQGLRGQMNTASLITGSKFIDLVFVVSANDAVFVQSERYSEIPTIDQPIAQLTEKLDDVLTQVSSIPFGQIGQDLSHSMKSLKTILATFEQQKTAQKMDGAIGNMEETLASANEALQTISLTVESVDHLIAPDSELKHELTKMLKSVSDVGESIQIFVDELNRHPNALISGAKKHD